MERTYINEVQKEIGSTVKVQGFIENLRNSKYMAFIVLKDITGKLQITVEKEDHPELVDTIDKLTPDSVITVTGKVMENDYVKMGGIEMIPESIEIESIADALPIVRKEIAATKKKKAVERSSIDQRIDYRWIDLRTDENQLMFKAQSCFVNAMRQFLLERSFIEIHTPKLIAAASESGSEVFKVDYFDRNAYLAQSPQFYKQMAMAAGFERIFETGPVFRAEKSYTNKHSTEFSGFDLEFSYITSYKDVMKMEEELLTAGLKAVKEQYGEQIKELFGLEVVVPTTPFPVVKLADLYKGLEEEFGYTVDESEKGDLTTEAERLSYDWVKKHYGHEFLFSTDYSAEKRAFYHMRDENGVPQGYDTSVLGAQLSQETILIAGPAERVDALESVSAGFVDLTKFKLGETVTLSITLPEGIRNLDALQSVDVTFDTYGFATRTVTVSQITVVNAPSDTTVTVTTRRLSDVTLVGPEDELDALSEANVVAQVDASASNINVSKGQQSMPVTIVVPGSSTVFATGSYEVLCDIDTSEGAG